MLQSLHLSKDDGPCKAEQRIAFENCFSLQRASGGNTEKEAKQMTMYCVLVAILDSREQRVHSKTVSYIIQFKSWWGGGGSSIRRSVFKCIRRAIFRLAVSVCCRREVQWTLNAKMRNTPYCIRVAGTTTQESIRLWEKALACPLVYIVKSGATARNTDCKFASFSWMCGDQIFSVVFDLQCED